MRRLNQMLLANGELQRMHQDKFDGLGVHLERVEDDIWKIAEGHTFNKAEVLAFMSLQDGDPDMRKTDANRPVFELPTPENEGASFDG